MALSLLGSRSSTGPSGRPNIRTSPAQALIQPIGLPDMDKMEIRNGFTLLPRRGGIVTNELVKTIQEQIDREGLEDALALQRKRPDRTS
jgi:hypothetical protein